LVYLYGSQGDTLKLLVVFAGLVGSIMVSYTRARAEGLGFECKDGLYARPERVITLVAGLLFYPWLFWFLVALAVLSNVTAIQRILSVWRLTHASSTKKAERHRPPAPRPELRSDPTPGR
jgi:CDP-diacylglycerol---glycerol-3-phosphate 3-phosphatidyltransferase